MASEASASSAVKRAGNGGHSDDDLSAQVGRLQKDLKEIAATVTRLADHKVDEARDAVRHEAKSIVRSGQHAVDEIQDEFGHMEKQLKDTIRGKPLTAVITAVGIGFVLAILSR